MALSSASESSINCIANGVALDIELSSSQRRGSRMSFHDIEYSVPIRPCCCGCCRKAGTKEILRGVSGVMKPGLNAIMGPTGSGKTSLLDVLAKRKDPERVSGKVLLNGERLPTNFEYLSGYVVQNDLFIGTVTVREALWFCANIRLPASMPRENKERKINLVLEQLGLQSCADTKIGTPTSRGISGGEKKRSSIAMEMLLDPQILFLDEPTTGLDAATASSVMRLLKKLGNEGNTIVCSIHQPRYSIYRLFDTLTLLSMGHLVYHGQSADTLQHFAKLGYECLPHDNPADFLLDVLIGEHERSANAIEEQQIGQAPEESNDLLSLTETLRDAAQNHVNGNGHTDSFNDTSDYNVHAFDTSRKNYATGTAHQLRVLLGRTFKDIVRNPRALVGNVVLNIIVGVLFGLLYFNVYQSHHSAVQNIFGILFFICTTLLFGSYGVINAFTAERDIFLHEHVGGYYRVVSYFLAKILADLIPLRTVAPIIFCAITYWMVGLKPTPAAFFTFLLTSLLLGYASVGIGLLYSSSFQPAIAQLCLVLTFVFTIIFSGLLVNVDEMLPWLAWLKYLSVARYGLVGLSVNELGGRAFELCENVTRPASSLFTFNVPINGSRGSNSSCVTIAGEDILFQSLSVGETPDSIGNWDLWKNNIALASVCVILYTLTYVQLARVRKYS